MENPTETEAILAAGVAISKNVGVLKDGSIPFTIVPDGYKVSSLENMLVQPTRKRGTVSVTDAGGFITYMNRHCEDGTLVYADIDQVAGSFKLVGVINDSSAEEPGWRDHTCTMDRKRSVEWDRWIGKNKAAMSQADFAAWIEDNLADIATLPGFPSGQDILAMSIGFEANSEKRLRSKINLQNGGVRFEFVEDEDKDTRSSMQVFERFTLGLPVFDGSASAYPLEARLKYREKSGNLTFWYELIRPDRVFKTAVADELGVIKEGTSLMIVSGTPGL